MSPLKVAVVGCGHLGTIHARLINSIKDVELVAVVDPDAAARQKVAEENGSYTFPISTGSRHWREQWRNLFRSKFQKLNHTFKI